MLVILEVFNRGPHRTTMYWRPFFLPSFLSCHLLPSPVRLFYAIFPFTCFASLKPPCFISLHSDFVTCFVFIPAPLCSDKDLLSQTRTLAMSFVKCASTDTEHQYKLVKDISFWGAMHTLAHHYSWLGEFVDLKEHSCCFAYNNQMLNGQRAETGIQDLWSFSYWHTNSSAHEPHVLRCFVNILSVSLVFSITQANTTLSDPAHCPFMWYLVCWKWLIILHIDYKELC